MVFSIIITKNRNLQQKYVRCEENCTICNTVNRTLMKFALLKVIHFFSAEIVNLDISVRKGRSPFCALLGATASEALGTVQFLMTAF